jgi:hypothetical protein
MKRLGKWDYLLTAPFECSEQCCEYLKKKNFKDYEKKTGNKPFTGEMADDGMNRLQQYIDNGCNAFHLKRPKSTPMGFWAEKDIWDYLRQKEIPYSRIYDMGETRTGCIFCMFGCQLEKGSNRFQRMQTSHPQLYNYCMKPFGEGGLGLAEVMDYMNIPYKNNVEKIGNYQQYKIV